MPVFVVLLNVQVHVSPGFTVTSTVPFVTVLRGGPDRHSSPHPRCTRPDWTSVSVVAEPAATTLLSAEVRRVPGSIVTTQPGVIVVGAAGFGALTVQPAFCTPSTFLITLIVPVFVVLLNVQVHVSPGFTVTPTEPAAPF